MTLSNQSFFLGEQEILRMISKNSRNIHQLAKSHFSPVAGENRDLTEVNASSIRDIFGLEAALTTSDLQLRCVADDAVSTRVVRNDRKRRKVRYTASRNEKLRFRTGTHKGKIRKKVFCPKFGVPKVLFETREEAEQYIEVENETTRAFNEHKLFPYFCEACQGWHISSRDEYKKMA